jgi:hypothetical protein
MSSNISTSHLYIDPITGHVAFGYIRVLTAVMRVDLARVLLVSSSTRCAYLDATAVPHSQYQTGEDVLAESKADQSRKPHPNVRIWVDPKTGQYVVAFALILAQA